MVRRVVTGDRARRPIFTLRGVSISLNRLDHRICSNTFLSVYFMAAKATNNLIVIVSIGLFMFS